MEKVIVYLYVLKLIPGLRYETMKNFIVDVRSGLEDSYRWKPSGPSRCVLQLSRDLSVRAFSRDRVVMRPVVVTKLVVRTRNRLM